MTARVITIDPELPDRGVLAEAAAVLRAGGLVAFPTETVYGLGANALDAAAVQRIFTAKGRPSFNPLIAHVADVEGARALVTVWPPVAEKLARHFWPGPLTIALPKREHVPNEVTAGRSTVAVRVPAHKVARALIAEAGIPLAAPSANRYTQLSPVTAAQVMRSLGDRVDLILDGGRAGVGIESTVVDLSTTPPMLLRPGTITRAALERITGPLASPGVPERADEPRAAPGMIARHYAPRARVHLVESDMLADAVDTVDASDHSSVAAITWSARGFAAGSSLRRHYHLPGDASGYAAELYASLHAADDAGCAEVLVEQPPPDSDWDGVRDRLMRAAHH